MKYTGRIGLISIFISNMIIWTTFHYMTYYKFFVLDMVSAIVYIPLCWWMGLQYDRVKYNSEKDSLTGVHNRRFVHGMFSKLRSLADRNQKSMAFLLIDINNFKTINDEYGHKMGDLVLQKISHLLIESTRKSDIVSRWGGDEFLIVAPFIDNSGLESLIERLHEGINDLSQSVQTNTSISIGSSIYPVDGKELDELIKIADQKMYQKKAAHKNDRDHLA